ncbi:MAG TPA: hypothetical protein DCQ58_12010 [Saprospirales bacterium]|nr:hypothetical protein [Saprospirales bacterium]
MLQGCVSSSKYFQQVEENKLLNTELRSLKYLNGQNEKLKATIAEQNEKLYLCENKLEDTEQKVKSLIQQNQILQQDQAKMNERNKALLEKAFDDKRSLTDDLIAKQVVLNEKEKIIRKLELKLAGHQNVQSDEEFNSASISTNLATAKDSQLAYNSDTISDTRVQLTRNLELLASGEYTIEQTPSGLLAVVLNESLLFEVNSIALSEKGKNALLSLLRLLNSKNVKDVCVENIVVPGMENTPEMTIRTGRLLSVYQAFIEMGINPKQLVLSGQKPNETKQSKAYESSQSLQKIKIEFNPGQAKN